MEDSSSLEFPKYARGECLDAGMQPFKTHMGVLPLFFV